MGWLVVAMPFGVLFATFCHFQSNILSPSSGLQYVCSTRELCNPVVIHYVFDHIRDIDYEIERLRCLLPSFPLAARFPP